MFLLLFFFSPQTLQASNLRIHLFSRHSFPTVEIQSPEDFQIQKLGNNSKSQLWPAQKIFKLEKGSPRLRLSPKPGSYLVITLPNGIQRRLPNSLLISTRENHLHLIAQVPLEEYVATVLASEMPTDFPLEALKAQAVLIRSKALAHQKQHGVEGFDFCDTTHCQVFNPSALPEVVREASRQTRGQILTYRGQIIEIFYHSTCGGHTSPNHRVFGGQALPYLQGVSDHNFCAASPHTTWEAQFKLEEIETALKRSALSPGLSGLKNIQALDGDTQGRLFQLALIGDKGDQISTENFRIGLGRQMGWNRLKSNFFSVHPQDRQLAFHGHGLGHGVGLCQWGARGMALQGKTYPEILSHYFPGTRSQRHL